MLLRLAVGLWFLVAATRAQADLSDSSGYEKREILLSVFQAAGGYKWTSSENWIQNGVDVCEWHGIICFPQGTRDGRRVGEIQKIDLRNNHLVGTIPTVVFEIPYLESVLIGGNSDVAIDLSNVARADFLTELDISNTLMYNLDGIENARNLETLRISDLNLRGNMPSGLFQLTNLEYLFANSNSFSGPLPASIGRMTSLRELHLDDNALTGQIPNDLGSLSLLEQLSLANNAFGGNMPFSAFNNLINLRLIDIQRGDVPKGDGISGQVPAFSNHQYLTTLNLRNQRFSGSLDRDFILDAPSGENVLVDLRSNDISGAVPDSLIDKNYLTILLSDNAITSVPSQLISGSSCPDLSNWMNGDVKSLGCEAFLCPPGTWGPEGRATRGSSCSSCSEDNRVWGRTSCSSSATSDVRERQILVNLYNVMGGRNWKIDDKWLSLDTSVCEWYGVGCNSSGQVNALVLRNNGLSGSPPDDLFGIPQLRNLNLESNAINFSFRGINSASNLEVLNVADTNLPSFEISNFQDLQSLSNLRVLNVAHNDLLSSIPTAIFSLRSLVELNIGHNGFTGSLDDRIGQLTRLQRLAIDGNKLTGQLPPELGNLVSLQELDAGENQFGGTLPESLNALTNLRSLTLQQVITAGGIGGPLLSFRGLDQLTTLQLGSNQLTGNIPPDFLANSRKLGSEITVGLAYNLLEGELPSQWSRFDRLNVDLTGNRITGIATPLCEIGDWMGGDVRSFGCDGILCPRGTSNIIGRKSDANSECSSCSGGAANYLGQTSCNGERPSFGENDGSEKGILDDFFAATHGTGWTQNVGWGDSTNPCSLYGVTCDGAGRVTSIDLTNNGLEGKVPGSIFRLPHLNELILSNNAIDMDFEEISTADSLVSLHLDSTKIESLDGLGRAPSLAALSLADNSLKGDIPVEIFLLSNLRDLDLGYNQFAGRLPNTIGALSSLETLRLYHNKFTGRLPAALGDLTNLKELNLAENNFDGTIPLEFGELTNLQFLSLQREGGIVGMTDVGINHGGSSALGSGLTGPLPSFDTLTSISELYLGFNSLTGSIPSNFLDGVVDTASEIKVDITSNKITGTVPASLTQFDSMSLYAAGNQITDIADGLCSKDNWMDSDVGRYQCFGILCPADTFNDLGRVTASTPTCQSCTFGTQGFMGSFYCRSTEDVVEGAEREILEKFYREMNGDNWLDNTNWMDDEESICSWHGIQCISNDFPSVASIELGNNRLLNDFVTQIYQLPSLRTLNLEGNDIQFSLAGIQFARGLTYLDVADTGLTTLDGISRASNLQLLQADRNSLSTFPAEVFSLDSLQYLSLSENPLKPGPIPPLIQNLPNLLFFGCDNCKFTGPVPSWIGNFTSLEFLDLAQNALTGTLPTELLELQRLKHIDLSDQASYGGGLSGSLLDFSTQSRLTELYLQHNNFQGTIPSTMLGGSANDDVVTLDLRYNQLTGTVPVELAQIDEMNLFLSSNRIDALPEALCNTNWNDGNTGIHGCDGILCSKGSFNAFGRAIGELECMACNSPSLTSSLGSIYCGPDFEHTALISIYQSTGGPSWKSDTNWLQTEDHCTWEGITCHEGGEFDGLVQKIELEDNNLFGVAALDQIWQLEGLEVLNLQKNTVVVIFSGIQNSINLETVILSEINTVLLAGIGEASNLKALHLTNAGLGGPIPDELFALSQLERLYMSHNFLSGTLSTLVGQLTSLQELYMFGNQLEGSLPSELGLLRNVEHMSLGRNKFTGFIPRQLSSLPNLQVLSLEKEEEPPSDDLFSIGGGGLQGLLPALNGLPNLRELYLGHNSFTGPIPNNFLAGIADKTELITVDLSYNLLDGSIPAEFAGFANLQLELGSNNIQGIPDEICAKQDWFNGEVANGCDAILCFPGTFNDYGRRIDGKTPCENCTYPGSSRGYGSVSCGPIFVQGMQEREILLELYDAAGGSSWTKSAGWKDDSVSFCDWYGVTCEPEGDLGKMTVTEIELIANNLDGLIPSILFHLPELRKLDFRDNKDVAIGLNAIFRAEKLEEVYLDKTRITDIEGIGRASSLRILHLQSNSFGWQPIPDDIFDLSGLEDLSLSDSMFGGTLSTNIGRLSNLKRLSLVGNGLSGQIPTEIGNLQLLEELELSNNNWYGTLPNSINALISLKSLYLSNAEGVQSGVSGQLPAFNNMPDLRELHLMNNQFTGVIPANFMGAVDDTSSNIKVFLNGNHIVGTVPSQLSVFEKLNIHLEDNLITALGDGLCDNPEWLDGNVGRYGCDAILCPAGQYSPAGRQVSDDTACSVCPDALSSPYLGSSFCVSIQKQREKEILQMVFQSTDGENWKENDGWMDDAFDICSWYGIKCKEGSTVESILLGSNRLVGTLPTEIYELPNLKFLWVYSNHVDISFDGIAKAVSLRSLLLDSTKIRSLDGIGLGMSLVDVDVRFNNLQGSIPIEMSNLVNLESFTCSDNRLVGKLPDLTSLRKLTTLRMGNNRLTGTLPAFANNPALQSLDLSQNELVGPIPTELFQSVDQSQSIFLDLSNNDLSGTVPGELSRFFDMTLYLRDNRFDGVNPNLCEQTSWNGGDVGSFKCDGILCPTGTFSNTGRASRSGATCEPCSKNKFFGQTACGTSDARQLGAMGLVTTLLLFTGFFL